MKSTELTLKVINKSCTKLENRINNLPISLNVAFYSYGRKIYEKLFVNQKINQEYTPNQELSKTLWGIKFRTPLFNSAGMFKNGDGYDVIAKLGAGAYLGGTSTYNPRLGNSKDRIYLPFTKLPKSKISINFLGLPNQGDEVLSKKLITKEKLEGCPIGWSVMRSPDFPIEEAQEKLVESLFMYQQHPQIDFIEINESCPNIKTSSKNMIARINHIGEAFLKKRTRKLPVIIKLSNDIGEEMLAEVLKALVRNNFDGVNLGNTSTDYPKIRDHVEDDETRVFDYFTNNFGGGIGGRVLKENSLRLCKIANREIKKLQLNNEFHIIRTGGVETFNDINASEEHGVSLNQWHTGFFFSYLKNGSNVYQNIFKPVPNYAI